MYVEFFEGICRFNFGFVFIFLLFIIGCVLLMFRLFFDVIYVCNIIVCWRVIEFNIFGFVVNVGYIWVIWVFIVLNNMGFIVILDFGNVCWVVELEIWGFRFEFIMLWIVDVGGIFLFDKFCMVCFVWLSGILFIFFWLIICILIFFKCFILNLFVLN